jgi:hypothetical protein
MGELLVGDRDLLVERDLMVIGHECSIVVLEDFILLEVVSVGLGEGGELLEEVVIVEDRVADSKGVL